MSPIAVNAFADAPGLPNWWRLLLAFVATVHLLLCLRVVLMRAWRSLVDREPPEPERVPTAAMIAYGAATFHIAYVMLLRIQSATREVVVFSLIDYSLILIAGSIAFTQIVYLTRRRRRS